MPYIIRLRNPDINTNPSEYIANTYPEKAWWTFDMDKALRMTREEAISVMEEREWHLVPAVEIVMLEPRIDVYRPLGRKICIT